MFQFFAEIPIVVEYSHNVILDDVGHKYPFFVRHSTFK